MSEEQLIPTPGVFGETGNFLLERELGRGGMGGVYMGRDKMLDRPVAVKVMLKEYGADPEFVEKFKREAQAAARLIHPNIAQVYSYGIADGMPYIAMELVAGGSLDKLMANAGKSIDIPRVMKICEQVAQALRCAADQGLVHGDVKPENVLLDANGNAKLVDFGLAAMQKDTNEIWGTPYYIAPEKVKKEQVDYRADMYSLGGTLYHALTGVAPFEGDDAAAVVRKRFEGAPVPPSKYRPEITPAIDALVLKMLALNPSDRFPSFEALLEEFKSVMAHGLTAGAGAGASAATPRATNMRGGRKVVVRGTKRFKMKTSVSASEGGGESGEDAQNTTEAPSAASSEDDEEESGSVIGKVLGVIGITIAVIGLVAGGLIWFVVSSKNAREAELRAQIERKFGEANTSIAETRKNAAKFADEVDVLAQKSMRECEKTTQRLLQELSGKVDESSLEGIKPGPTAELIAAIASTNAAAAAAAAPAPAPASTNAVDAAASTNATAEAQAPEPAAEQAAEPASAFDKAIAETLGGVTRDMSGLWERAYGSLAASIRIRKAINELVAKIDAFKVEGDDEETLNKVAEFSNEVKNAYDLIKASEDVSKVQKAVKFIQSRGANTVQQTINRLLVAVKEEQRRKEAEDKRKAAEERQQRLAEEKEKAIEEDNEKVKEKFDALVAAGTFKLLDWSSATRQLQTLHDELRYAESQILAKIYLKKVEMMSMVQEIFIVNSKGYKFARAKGLAGCTITGASEKDGIKLKKADGKTSAKMSWVKFYQQYHGGLNELIVNFIEKGKDTSRLKGGKRLSLQPWAEAMMGAALTMQIICGDDQSAAARAEAIAKEAVKALPDYLNRAQEIFPDVKFEGAEQE